MSLLLTEVSIRRGEALVVDRVSFEVRPAETVVLLGPSGSGKTSLLRAIAGLDPIAGGRIEFAGEDLAALPTHRRGFGYVFQGLALFPHLDVGRNVEYGLRVVGVVKAARVARVGEVLAQVGLAGFERRSVSTLSGGERQRVAIARCLAVQPRLLLLDEPLGALDRQLRDRLVGELRSLLDATGLPAIVVTHDHDEARALADRVAILRAGHIAQFDTTERVWAEPADEWVAGFLGVAPTADGG